MAFLNSNWGWLSCSERVPGMERPFYSNVEWNIGMLITVNMLEKLDGNEEVMLGCGIICHTKGTKHEPFHFSLLSARLLKQIFLHSLNVPRWNIIEGHTIKVTILTRAKPFYWYVNVCKFRPIMFVCTFNTISPRCKLIRLGYF